MHHSSCITGLLFIPFKAIFQHHLLSSSIILHVYLTALATLIKNFEMNFSFWPQATTSTNLEPLAFRLMEEDSSPVKKVNGSDTEDHNVNAEVNEVGLPDELRMTSNNAAMNRSFSAPPTLVCVFLNLKCKNDIRKMME